jgi:hypothetical protein
MSGFASTNPETRLKIVTDRFDDCLRQAFAYAARLTGGIVLLYGPGNGGFDLANGA